MAALEVGVKAGCYELYGNEISLFTGKARAYLRWKGLPYEEIAADARVYRDVILPRVGFPVVPVLVTPDGATLQDTTEIIEELERRHPQPSITPTTPRQRLVAALLELYGDEWLVIPAMHYRWHHNRDWAERAFGEANAPDESAERQQAIGAELAGPFARAAVQLGAQPHMHAAIEASYEALLGELDAHFTQHDYVLGSRPSLADFGLIGPLYAHQYRDPASGEIMRRLAPAVVRWVRRMQEPERPASGEFLSDDQVPDTLVPVLARMMREQLPVLEDTADRLRHWLAAHPDEPIRRVLGSHAYTLGEASGERMVMPYCLWMMQRARDVYRGFDSVARDAADEMLASVGGEGFIAFADPPRLARDGMKARLA